MMESIGRSRYVRAALLLGVAGLLFLGLGVVFPDSQSVLFSLAGTAVVGAILISALTPRTTVPAEVGDALDATLNANERAMVDEFGLRGDRQYRPVGAGTADVRLVVGDFGSRPPATDALETGALVRNGGDVVGLSLYPVGAPLYERVEPIIESGPSSDPDRLVRQLTEATTDRLELAGEAAADVDVAAGRARVTFTDVRVGSADSFDHPVLSLLAVGIARNTGTAVRLTAVDTNGTEGSLQATFEWPVSAEEHEDLADAEPQKADVSYKRDPS